MNVFWISFLFADVSRVCGEWEFAAKIGGVDWFPFVIMSRVCGESSRY